MKTVTIYTDGAKTAQNAKGSYSHSPATVLDAQKRLGQQQDLKNAGLIAPKVCEERRSALLEKQ